MNLVGPLVTAVGFVLLVTGMWLIGVPVPFIGAVFAACGLATLVAGVTVNWDAKPSE